MGFGHTYKNFQHCIQATALLKDKYPDIFFTAIFSESPYNKMGHQIYYNELTNLIQKLKIEDHVSILRGFQSDNTLDSYLRTNKVAVFPYNSSLEHTVYGASGMARLAMSKNIPVITSHMPLFLDLPTIKTTTPEQTAQQLDLLFTDKTIVEQQLILQSDYIKNNSWDVVAQQHVDIFES
jgi:glycosyltransferase involved in cell wall biosynthesis